MIYVASKTKHSKKWLTFKDAGYLINSTWIHGVESTDLEDLWKRRCIEVNMAKVLVAYREKGDILKGAFIEIGVALSKPKLVLLAGDWEGMSFLHHPTVKQLPTLNEAMAQASRICRASSVIVTKLN